MAFKLSKVWVERASVIRTWPTSSSVEGDVARSIRSFCLPINSAKRSIVSKGGRGRGRRKLFVRYGGSIVVKIKQSISKAPTPKVL